MEGRPFRWQAEGASGQQDPSFSMATFADSLSNPTGTSPMGLAEVFTPRQRRFRLLLALFYSQEAENR
jgi:hypothetical protein